MMEIEMDDKFVRDRYSTSTVTFSFVNNEIKPNDPSVLPLTLL